MKISADKLQEVVNSNIEFMYTLNPKLESEITKHYKQLLKDSKDPNRDHAHISAMMLACLDKSVKLSVETTLNTLIEIGLLSLE